MSRTSMRTLFLPIALVAMVLVSALPALAAGGNVRVATNGPSFTIQWTKWTTASCSGTAAPGSTAVSTTNATLTDADTGESVEITAPAVSGYNFVGWSGHIISSDPVICVAGSNGTKNLVASYAVITSIAAGSVTATTSTYGGTTNLSATVAPANSPGSVAFKVSGAPAGAATYTQASGVATLSGYTHGLGASVTPYSVEAVFTPTTASTHAASSGTSSTGLTVNKANQAITITTPAPATKGYQGEFTVAATSGSGDAVTFSSDGVCSNVGATFTMTAPSGTCTVEYNQAGNGNYNPAPEETETVTAEKANQVITITAPLADATMSYLDEFTAVATGGGSGNPVVFTSDGACSNDGADFTMTSGTGTCSVIANQAGDDNYNAATEATRSVSAGKASQAALTVTSPTAGTFGDELSPTATGGSGTGTVSFTADGTACEMGDGDDAGKLLITSGTGTCSVTAHQAGDDNYEAVSSAAALVTISKASQTIVVTTSAPTSSAYNSTFAVVATGGDSGQPVEFGASGSCQNTGADYTMTSGVGSCTVHYNQLGNANYNAATEVTESVTATKATQPALSVSGPTSGTFGEALVMSSTGGAGDGAVTFEVTSGAACSIPADGVNAGKLIIDSGTGTCSITATRAADDNYAEASSDAAAVTINKATQPALSVSGPTSGTFGEALVMSSTGGAGDGAVTFEVTSGAACSIPADGVNAGKLIIDSGTGTCSITATRAADDNYAEASSDAAAVTINKATQAALSVTTDPDSGSPGDKLLPVLAGGSGDGAVTYTAEGGQCDMGTGADEGLLVLIDSPGTCSITVHKAADDNYAAASSAPHAVTVVLGTVEERCSGIPLSAGNHIVGGAGNNTLEGTPGRDIICGLGGRDTIRGRGGNDLLIGGGQGDSLYGGGGSDVLRGGSGADLLNGGSGNDTCRGGKGQDSYRRCESRS